MFHKIKHWLLHRKFLNDTGVIYQDAIARLKYTSFHFLVADGPSFFITSDTPAFVHKRADTSLVGLLPITLRIFWHRAEKPARKMFIMSGTLPNMKCSDIMRLFGTTLKNLLFSIGNSAPFNEKDII